MSEENVNLPILGRSDLPAQKEQVKVPLFRRDLFPSNLILSAEDIREFCGLLEDVNARAKIIEYSRIDLKSFVSSDDARQRIDSLIPLEYTYVSQNGDSVQGLGVPKVDDVSFPEDLVSFFISNAEFTERAIDARPMNTVEVFLNFAKPTLKIDWQSPPSNPTDNRSVVNVAGRDEDWVISTTEKIQNFLKKRTVVRPIIHGAGAYDYLIYLLILPSLVWFIYSQDGKLKAWLDEQSVFLNVVLAFYAILATLFCARFVFQYIRWLFPPMEYFKKSRWGAYIHRGIAGTILASVVLSAIYDILKSAL